MRAPIVMLISGLVLVSLAPVASASAAAPVLSPGDLFDTNSTFSSPRFTSASASHAVVEGTETITLGGASYLAVKTVTTTDTNASALFVVTRSNSTTTTWTRASDGALLRSNTTTTTIAGIG